MSRSSTMLSLALLALVAGQVACYGNWIIDDAGITYAYARNALAGDGWVAQPGAAPVEGLTNLLWALLLMATMAVGCFDPVWTPKVLGTLLAVAALLQVRSLFASASAPIRSAATGGLLLVATNPAYVLWACSGLENPLLALLCATALRHATRAVDSQVHARDAVLAGALVVGCGLARPDGLVFGAAFPLLVLANGHLASGRRLRLAALAALTVVVGIGAVTLWRWWYFGDFVPNTFRAKADAPLFRFVRATALSSIAGMCAFAIVRGRLGSGARFGLASIASLAFWRLPDLLLPGVVGTIGRSLHVLGYFVLAAAPGLAPRPAMQAAVVFAHLGMLQFFALPPDWMGEFRFATCFLMVEPVLLAVAFAAAAARAGESGRQWPRWLAAVLAAVVIAAAAGDFWQRIRWLQANPTVSFAFVQQSHQRARQWLPLLQAPSLTMLAPDLGGRLWLGGCEVIDLSGLCDRRIARLIGRDPAALANLVLTDIRPTLIEMHGYSAWQSGLLDDARFRGDYQHVEGQVDPWIQQHHGRAVTTGWFVRADALRSSSTLEAMRR